MYSERFLGVSIGSEWEDGDKFQGDCVRCLLDCRRGVEVPNPTRHNRTETTNGRIIERNVVVPVPLVIAKNRYDMVWWYVTLAELWLIVSCFFAFCNVEVEEGKSSVAHKSKIKCHV